MGVEKLFAVQARVIPMTLSFQHRDICVAAPTGSGKTLGYAIPIVQALAPRIIPRLRALILLPSRDLVVQVKGVFDGLVSKSPSGRQPWLKKPDDSSPPTPNPRPVEPARRMWLWLHLVGCWITWRGRLASHSSMSST